MVNAAQTGVSWKPADYAVGGGLIDDADLLVKEARVVNFTYPNTSVTTVALRLILTDDEDQDHEQMYTCGDPKNFSPSPDGLRMVPTGQVTALSNSTNAAQLFDNLVGAGFPVERMTEEVTFIEGLYGHWRRIAQPKREGLANNRLDANKAREQTVLVCSEIKNLPWEASKRPKAGGAASATAAPRTRAAAAPRAATPAAAPTSNGNGAAPAAEASDDVTEICRQFLKEQIGQPPFEFPAQVIAQAGWKTFSDQNHPDKMAISKMLFEPSFLTQMEQEGICAYNAETKVVSAV